jgi:hypothetical protein
MALAAGLALVGIAGCSQGGSAGKDTTSPTPSAQPGGALANLDPCTIAKPEQLSAAGLPAQGKPQKRADVEPGCEYDSGIRGWKATIYRNATTTFDSYRSQPNWAKVDPVDVNGRPAVNAIDKQAVGAKVCTTIFSAGGGSIVVDAQPGDPRKATDASACDQGLKFAKQIEPNLPK